MTGVMGGARVCSVRAGVYGVRARVYGVRARVYGTPKILVSAPVPFGLIGFYWDLVGFLGLRVWGRGLKINEAVGIFFQFRPSCIDPTWPSQTKTF